MDESIFLFLNQFAGKTELVDTLIYFFAVFLPYWIAAQYVQSLFFWSEHRYLMPFYPLLILMALSWYWNRWKKQTRGDLDPSVSVVNTHGLAGSWE